MRINNQEISTSVSSAPSASSSSANLIRQGIEVREALAVSEDFSTSSQDLVEGGAFDNIDPLMRLKVQVSMLSEIRRRQQFMNRELSYLLKIRD